MENTPTPPPYIPELPEESLPGEAAPAETAPVESTSAESSPAGEAVGMYQSEAIREARERAGTEESVPVDAYPFFLANVRKSFWD